LLKIARMETAKIAVASECRPMSPSAAPTGRHDT
jgi:hypothetical protein